MGKFLFLIVFLFQTLVTIGQESLDSLEITVETDIADTIKVKHLYELSKKFSNLDIDKFYRYSTRGLLLAQRLNDPLQEAKFTQELGFYYRKSNKIDSAYLFYENAKEKYLETQDSASYFYVNYDIGNLNRGQGKYIEAQQSFLDGINYFQRQMDDLSRNRVLIGNFNLASVQRYLENYDDAISYYKEILGDTLAYHDKRLLRVTYINLSSSFLELKQLDSSLHYVKLADPLATSKRSRAYLQNNIGSILEQQSKWEEALKHYKESEAISLEIGDKKAYYMASDNIGNIFTLLGRYDDAEVKLIEVENNLKETNLGFSKKNNYLRLERVYLKKENYQKAHYYSKRYSILSDSLLNVEKQTTIADLEVQYETEKLKNDKTVSESKVVLAENKSKRSRLFFIAASIIGSLILLSSLFFFSRLKERKRAEMVLLELKETQKRLALEKQYRSSELKAIKSQMNPHFIFNALNSIQEYIITNEKNLAADYLGKFADLIRAYLNYSNEGTVTLDEEIRTLEMYLQLEELRFEEKLNYKIVVDEELDLSEIEIPTMLIQPYVENAFKHGLLHKKDNRNLLLSFDLSPDKTKLLCTVQDDGVGRERALEIKARKNINHKSFASKATEDRLALLNFGKEDVISVEIQDLKSEDNIPEGTKVSISIPIS